MTSIIKICMKDGNRKSFFCPYQKKILKISLAGTTHDLNDVILSKVSMYVKFSTLTLKTNYA